MLGTVCLDSEGYSQCVAKVITTSFAYRIARHIASSWNKTDTCSLGYTGN